MPLLELLVEVLDGEALVVLLIQRAHARELVLGRPPGRRLADPAIDQAVRPLVVIALPPAAQRPLAHPQRRGRLAVAQAAAFKPLQQLLEAHDPDPSQSFHPAHPAPALLERLPNRTDHALPKPANSRAPYTERLKRLLTQWLRIMLFSHLLFAVGCPAPWWDVLSTLSVRRRAMITLR